MLSPPTRLRHEGRCTSFLGTQDRLAGSVGYRPNRWADLGYLMTKNFNPHMQSTDIPVAAKPGASISERKNPGRSSTDCKAWHKNSAK